MTLVITEQKALSQWEKSELGKNIYKYRIPRWLQADKMKLECSAYKWIFMQHHSIIQQCWKAWHLLQGADCLPDTISRGLVKEQRGGRDEQFATWEVISVGAPGVGIKHYFMYDQSGRGWTESGKNDR